MNWQRAVVLKKEELEERRRSRSLSELRSRIQELPPRPPISWSRLRPVEDRPAEAPSPSGSSDGSSSGSTQEARAGSGNRTPSGTSAAGPASSSLLILPPSSGFEFDSSSPFSLEALIAAEFSSRSIDQLVRPPTLPIISELKRRPVPGEVTRDYREIPPVDQVYGSMLPRSHELLLVWTNSSFYGGPPEDLAAIRHWYDVRRDERPAPGLIRADLIIDPYQVVETAALGGDALVLVAEAVGRTQLEDLIGWADELALPVLVYVRQSTDVSRALKAGAQDFAIGSGDLFDAQDRSAPTAGLLREMGREMPRATARLSWGGVRELEDHDERAWAGATALVVGRAWKEVKQALRRRDEEGS